MNGQWRKSGRSTTAFTKASGRTKLAIAAAVAATSLAGATASAQLIATDHFVTGATPANGEYATTSLVTTAGVGQNPTIAGFTGAWASSGVLKSEQWVAQNTALDISSVGYESGGRLRFQTTAADNVNTRIYRNLSAYTPVSTYYVAMHSNITTGDTDLDGFIGAGFTNAVVDTDLTGATGNLRGFMIGAKGNAGTAKTDLVIRHHGVSGLQDDVIVAGIGTTTTRLEIVKLEVNADPGNPLGNDRLTVYHSPTNAYTEALAALTSQATVLNLHSATMDTTADITQLTAASLDYSTTSHFDEPRLAADWGNVSGFAQTQWTTTGAGSWVTPGNWSNGLPSNLAAQFLGAVSSNTTVSLGSSQTVGAVVFDNPNYSYTLSGSPLVIQPPTGSTGAILVSSGSHTIASQVNLSNNTLVSVTNAGSTLTMSGGINPTAAIQFSKSGAGTLEAPFFRSSFALQMFVNDGLVKVSPNGTTAGVSKVNSLTMGTTGKLDLTDNKLIVIGGTLGAWNGTNYTGLTGSIKSARNGGGWNGNGILTSMTDAIGDSALTTIAIAKADDIGKVGLTFGGITVAAGDILMGYTYAGDMNLDGSINGDDYARIDNGFVGVLSGYENGDLDYNGKIDADDYFLIDRNYSRQGSPFAAAPFAGGASAVPEPGSLSLLSVGAALLLRRKRR